MSRLATSDSRIVFRCNGGTRQGFGHVYRCVVLAGLLADNYRIRFVVNSNQPQVLKLVKKVTDDVVMVGDFPEPDRFPGTIESGDVVVLDIPDAGEDYQDKIRGLSRSVVCLDDDHSRHFTCDAVINHSPGVGTADYSRDNHTKLYLGLDYALLRPAFLQRVAEPSVPEQLNRLLVCFGATDPNKATERFFKATLAGMRRLPELVSLVVGSGLERERIDRLGELAQRAGLNLEVCQGVDEQRLLQLIRASDAAVTSASTIALEVISQRRPLYLQQTTADQASNFQFLTGTGAAEEVGKIAEFSPDKAQKMMLVQNGLHGENVVGNIREIFKQYF